MRIDGYKYWIAVLRNHLRYAKLLRITHEPCPGIATRCPELAPGLAAVVDRMVARDPAQRFATAREVAAALAPFAEVSRLPALIDRMPSP